MSIKACVIQRQKKQRPRERGTSGGQEGSTPRGGREMCLQADVTRWTLLVHQVTQVLCELAWKYS